MDTRAPDDSHAPPSGGTTERSLRGVVSERERTPSSRVPDPTRIAHFRLEGRLGTGGMGIVFRATDEALKRTVAIKILPLGFEAEEDRRARFLREARAAAALNHPNLATIYEVGEADGRIYIAMEYCAGATLKSVLASKRLSIEDVLATATEIAKALAHAHASGIIHRDLKPDNVMLAPDGRVKILDFGLAKSSVRGDADDVETMTEVGQFLGTPAYVSPEQARGDATLSGATDVFSFGVILYEMLTGKRPFDGASLALILQSVATRTPAPPSELDARVPPALDRLVARCLAKGVGERIGSGGELVAALALLPSPPESAPAPTRPVGSRRLQGRAIVAGLLVVVAVVVVLGLRRSTNPGEGPAAGGSALAGSGHGINPGSSLAASAGGLTFLTPPVPVTSPAPLTHYRTALRDIRSASMGHANAELAQALALDPTFAAALLRYGIYSGIIPVRLRDAMRFRDKLDARDESILHALEPEVFASPPDHVETARRLHALADAAPTDVEVLLLWGRIEGMIDIEREREPIARAQAVDPGMAYGELLLGNDLRNAGLLDEALQHFETCERIAPIAATCMRGAARIQAALGDCTGYARETNKSVRVEPSDYWAQFAVLAVRMNAGADHEELAAQLERLIATPFARGESAPTLTNLRLSVDRSLRFWVGDLEGARQDPRTYAQIVNSGDVGGLLDVLEEVGDDAGALRLARAYLAARGPETPASDETSSADNRLWHGRANGAALRILHKARTLTPERTAALQARSLQQAEDQIGALPDDGWLEHYVEPALDEREARAALAMRGDAGPFHFSFNEPRQWERLGRLYLLAGEPALAGPWLERAATACQAIDGNVETSFVASILHARHELGLAREKLGDLPGACAAHASVIDRWGDAKPRSVTADASRARLTALKCPARVAGP